MGSLAARAVTFSLKLGSTAELRALPGRALLGLTLRLVSAVCGSGHSIGYMGSTADTFISCFNIPFYKPAVQELRFFKVLISRLH